MLRVLSRLAGMGEQAETSAHRSGGVEQGAGRGQLPGRVVYLPQVLVRMRLGGKSNRNLKEIVRKSWEDYQILRRQGQGQGQGQGDAQGLGPLGAAGALAWKNLSKVPQFVQRG